MNLHGKCVRGVRGGMMTFSILSKLRNSKLFLEGKTHHARGDTPDGPGDFYG